MRDESESDLALTENGELHRFLDEAALSLEECGLPRFLVRDAFDGDLTPSSFHLLLWSFFLARRQNIVLQKKYYLFFVFCFFCDMKNKKNLEKKRNKKFINKYFLLIMKNDVLKT